MGESAISSSKLQFNANSFDRATRLSALTEERNYLRMELSRAKGIFQFFKRQRLKKDLNKVEEMLANL